MAEPSQARALVLPSASVLSSATTAGSGSSRRPAREPRSISRFRQRRREPRRMTGDPVRILLVEDNEADVYLFRKAFVNAELNFELTVVVDGGEAMAFV